MSSERKLNTEAVQAARHFLLGRSGRPDPAPDERRETPVSPDPSPPREPPRLELSAAGLRRADASWRARCIHKRGVDSRHVKDARYGGYVGSFIQALEVRDRFHRERGLPIPWDVAAIVDGERCAPEVVRRGRSLVVRWQGEEHAVSGEDAAEVATEVALDLFVEFLDAFRDGLPASGAAP